MSCGVLGTFQAFKPEGPFFVSFDLVSSLLCWPFHKPVRLESLDKHFSLNKASCVNAQTEQNREAERRHMEGCEDCKTEIPINKNKHGTEKEMKQHTTITN